MSTSKSYHHGDLRSALLATGFKALESGDISDLSLRQLARDVGVSPTAVYRHFPDKKALLAALAEQGIEQLGESQQTAADANPADAFAATGRAYVRWALANPALFRLVFVQACDIRETVFGQNTAAQLLRGFANQIAGNPEGAERLMIQAWALVHGLAMLMLDKQLPPDDALIDQIIDPKVLFRA